MKPADFIRFARRLLFFLSKMKGNKYADGGNGIKINLYVPAFPGKAFYQACNKVMDTIRKMPAVTMLVSVTSACRFDCSHCYQKLDKGKDVDIGLLENAVRHMLDNGMAFINVEGGEPFLVYDRLKRICDAIDTRAEILVNSTGDGITVPRLRELNAKGNLMGIMFSLHSDSPDKLNAFMGSEKAWPTLVSGIEACHSAGVPVTFNSCLMIEDYYNGTFERVMDRAREFRSILIQLIKPKPAGAWLNSGLAHFSPEDLALIRTKVDSYNNDRAFRDYPAVALMIKDEDHDHFGCTAGGTDRFYINAKGDVQPCEFLNISFGNIAEEPFPDIYSRMRSVFDAPGDCWLCEQNAAKIASLLAENSISTLPLSPGLSRVVLEGMERGKVPDFYEKVLKM
jgi:MoaA/NifB/PqqE/SkfB family radical SAM enzyme